jgi:hypothetical protein
VLKLILAIVLALPSIALAATFSIGPVVFDVGASKSNLLPKLGDVFKLTPVGSDGAQFLVSDPKTSEDQTVGIVYFENDKLKWASHRLNTFTHANSSTEVLSALTSDIQRVAEASGSTAQVKTETTQDGSGNKSDRILFQFPGRNVELTSFTYANSEVLIMIDETLPR